MLPTSQCSSDALDGDSIDSGDNDSVVVSVGMDNPTNPTCLHADQDISPSASMASALSSTAASSCNDAGLEVPPTITPCLCDYSEPPDICTESPPAPNHHSDYPDPGIDSNSHLPDSNLDSNPGEPYESNSIVPIDCEGSADCDLSDSESKPSVDSTFPRTLTHHETQESLNSWQQDMLSWLAMDPNFEPFLSGYTWAKATRTQPFRGLSDDLPSGRSAHEKLLALNAMLARFSRFCPVLSPRAICDRATSIDMIWQFIYTHFGCTS